MLTNKDVVPKNIETSQLKKSPPDHVKIEPKTGLHKSKVEPAPNSKPAIKADPKKNSDDKLVSEKKQNVSKKNNIVPGIIAPSTIQGKFILNDENNKNSGGLTNLSKAPESTGNPAVRDAIPKVPISGERIKIIGNNRTFPDEIRSSVSSAEAALHGQTLSYRLRSLDALLKSIPDDLNAEEVASLLGEETLSSRQDCLRLIVNRMKKRSLNPDKIPKILGKETLSGRVNCLEIISPYIKNPITGIQAVEILGQETLSYRTRCIEIISPLLRRPLTSNETDLLLEGTSLLNRENAIRFLFGPEKEGSFVKKLEKPL